MHLHVDLILGLPFDTRESFRRSLNQVFSLGAHHIQMGLLKVLPTTPISREADRYGLVFCEQPPYEVLATRWLTHRELSELYALGECVESFHNNRYFPTLWRYLRKSGEEPFLFFQELLSVCRQHGFFDLSVTQELLARMLCELAQGRADRELLLELLRYDWLSCGHRFLPPSLEGRPLPEVRAELRDSLPPSMDGWYGARERSEFLKRGVFLELSARAGEEIGLDREGGRRRSVSCPRTRTGLTGESGWQCLTCRRRKGALKHVSADDARGGPGPGLGAAGCDPGHRRHLYRLALYRRGGHRQGAAGRRLPGGDHRPAGHRRRARISAGSASRCSSGGSPAAAWTPWSPTGPRRAGSGAADDYTPGGLNNRRPDRAVLVYSNLIRSRFKNTCPIVLGGIEASLRRVAHYDFWDEPDAPVHPVRRQGGLSALRHGGALRG